MFIPRFANGFVALMQEICCKYYSTTGGMYEKNDCFFPRNNHVFICRNQKYLLQFRFHSSGKNPVFSISFVTDFNSDLGKSIGKFQDFIISGFAPNYEIFWKAEKFHFRHSLQVIFLCDLKHPILCWFNPLRLSRSSDFFCSGNVLISKDSLDKKNLAFKVRGRI